MIKMVAVSEDSRAVGGFGFGKVGSDAQKEKGCIREKQES
jgi:hypothetical protein